MKNRKFRFIISLTVTVLLFVFVCYLAQCILMPKYTGIRKEGALISEYYDEVKDHDVIIIGDCEVYENISPITLWEEYGITSYIRGSAQMLVWHSYYILEETLKYEKPDVVIFNVLAMKYNEPQSEAYNRMFLDGMKWSSTKLKAIKVSMTEEETTLSYLAPIFRFHSRWDELTEEDFKYMFGVPKVSHNGYLMRCDIKPLERLPALRNPEFTDFGENAYAYLDKITSLCKENDIELLLIKSPSVYPHWYDEWDQQIVDYAARNGLQYVNTLKLQSTIGIDMTTDTYDAGLHLNLYGAEKFSKWLVQYLQDTYNVADHRNDPELSARYEQKVAAYYKEKAQQESEIAEYGCLKIFKDHKEND